MLGVAEIFAFYGNSFAVGFIAPTSVIAVSLDAKRKIRIKGVTKRFAIVE